MQRLINVSMFVVLLIPTVLAYTPSSNTAQCSPSFSPQYIDFSCIPPAATPVDANNEQLFQQRAKVAIDWAACHRLKLDEIYRNEDDFMATAIAKLASSNTACDDNELIDDQDPNKGRVDNITEVNRALQRSQQRSYVGSSSDIFPCQRIGEYDVALKGLIPIMYLFPEKLEQRDSSGKTTYVHILNDLLNYDGGHDTGIMSWTCVGSIPESENHILMIETSRFLTNQLKAKAERDQGKPVSSKYDNVQNGFNDWMLQEMQQFLRNDFAEYNARPYQRYSIAAIQNIYDFTCDARVIEQSSCDTRVKVAAGMVLDYISAKFAVSSNGLRRAVPFRRLATFEPKKELFGGGLDANTSRFIVLSGLTQRLGDLQFHANPDSWDQLILAGISTYRTPNMILDLIMNKRHNSYYEKIYHGTRERKNIPGGVEIYASTDRFLISAGGIQVPSGMGNDFFTHIDDGIPIETTLMPTSGGTNRNNFIRINGNQTQRENRVNNCVASGFACGMNPVIPPDYVACSFKPKNDKNSPWTFIDTSKCPGKEDWGFYVAVYQAPCVSALCKYAASGSIYNPSEPPIFDHKDQFGFFEAATSDSVQSFDFFRDNILAKNNHDFTAEGENTYITSGGHAIRFIPNLDGDYNIDDGDRYTFPIISIDGHSNETNIHKWPLVSGDIISTLGVLQDHQGALSITNQCLQQQLILDMSDWKAPKRIEKSLVGQEVTIKPECGGQVSSHSGDVNVIFPDGTVSQPTHITLSEPTQIGIVDDTVQVLRRFVVSSLPQPTHFLQPFTMTVTYTPEMLSSNNINEDGLTLAYFDDQQQFWIPIPSHVDKENHQVLAAFDHATTFGLIASEPTAITLTRFTAQQQSVSTRITWATGAEIGTWSFDIYRSNDEVREHAERMTTTSILAQGREEGAIYTWEDTQNPPPSAYYWLAETEISGSVNWYGPTQSTPIPVSTPYFTFIPLVIR